jgi:uncharacterized integral membrane protein
MNRIYILTIILLLFALVFAIQNTSTIALGFLFWNFQGSLAFITLLIFFFGFIAGWILPARKVWLKNSQIKTLRSKLDEVQKTVNPASSKSVQ